MDNPYLDNLLTYIFGKDGYTILGRVMGGMMNVSILIGADDGKQYILYIPNGAANKLVNRQYEKENQSIAFKRDITSRNIYFDTDTGIKINEYIPGVSLDKANFPIDYQKVADLLHNLHGSKKLCPNEYNPFQRLCHYVNKANKYQNEDHRSLKVRDFFSSNIEYLEKNYVKCVCHNDAQKSNIVAGEDGKYYIIDFEFAGNNDPIYDIATFGNNSVDEGEELLKAYFTNPTLDEYKRYYLWRTFVSLQWHYVAIAKHYQGEGEQTGYNFLEVAEYFLKNAEEAKRRFERLPLE